MLRAIVLLMALFVGCEVSTGPPVSSPEESTPEVYGELSPGIVPLRVGYYWKYKTVWYAWPDSATV